MYNESNNLIITDIYWHNIYLHLCLNDSDVTNYKFYISDLKKQYFPIKHKENELIINIVNIPEVSLLENGKWYFVYEHDGFFNILNISSTCGYKFANLDKIYRYGAQKYAYIINFEVQEYGDKMEILSSNNTKVQNYDKAESNQITVQMHTSYMMFNKRGYKRNILIESKNLQQLIRKSSFIIIKKCIKCFYSALSFCRKKDGKHLLFMSETRVPISGNLKALDDRIKERGLDQTYKISYSFSKTLQQSKFKTFFTWFRSIWLIAKQDIIFVDDYVPIFKTIQLSKKTKLVQLWHAGVGFKSVGYSRFGKNGSPHPTDSCHRHYDYAVVGAEGLIPVYEEVFGIPEESFLPYGLPRLDSYMDEKKKTSFKETFYAQYPSFKSKKIIMFAPTYRGNTQDSAYYPYDKIKQDDVYEMCADEYIFIYKMHPFILEKVEISQQYADRIYDFSNVGDINELFYITDILITDFSSNIYEFALQEKPIIFYAFDKDFYQLTRGVHKTLDEAPGNVCNTFDEVIQVIKDKKFEVTKLQQFIEDSFPVHKDVLSCDRLIEKFLLKKGEEE